MCDGCRQIKHTIRYNWNNRINLEKKLIYFVAKGVIFNLTLAVVFGLTPPHWLKMTPTVVTENFCLGGRLRPPQSRSSITVCWLLVLRQPSRSAVAQIVSSFWYLWVELWDFTARRYTKRGIYRRRVSVRLSVTLRYCIKKAKLRITHLALPQTP